MRRIAIAVTMIGGVLIAQSARAQSRPLVTEDPETVPSGHMLVETGVDYQHQVFYPASGLTGNLWRIGTLGLSFGVSPIAEIQLDGGIRNHLSITKFEPAPLSSMLTVTGTSTGDFEDLTIGTKVRFMKETAGRPAMAVRFWTKLPNASNESGLGLDTTDFNFDLNIGKTVRSVRVVGNIGFGILGDAVRGDSQNDVLNYGVSLARAMRQDVEIVFEINGRASTRAGTPPPGTETRSAVRIGGRFTHGPVRVDAGLILGITTFDPTWGFTTGLTWVFKAFDVQ
ncbi:MAG TPA: transporter [Vicinamibacterales bacterium]|nr:transporter [Vicinamibacterales bacterium]